MSHPCDMCGAPSGHYRLCVECEDAARFTNDLDMDAVAREAEIDREIDEVREERGRRE